MTPPQKPGKSKQNYGTPPALLRAIERDFNVILWTMDLAAEASNAIVHPYLGPASTLGEDALTVPWPEDGDLWLNEPFADIEPWVVKCAHERDRRRGRIFQLTPASVGSNWFLAGVHGKAHVVSISPRVTFVGETTPYPKDLILIIWSAVRGGFSTWRWK